MWGTSFEDSIPELYNFACHKDAWVEENMETPNGLLHWNVLFIRPMHDWEFGVITRFLVLLYSQKIRVGGKDKICWIPSKSRHLVLGRVFGR